MNNYLLSWYGITDLRAALGLESSDGPLLSALKTNEYTDLVLLAYTDASKVPVPTSGDPVSDFNAMKNTPLAHQTFVQWLDHSLAEIGVDVRIHVLPQELAHLNDATGIHAGATAAVRFGLADSVSPRLTAYVSPGTPVMAYTWALIARSNPQLGIRVISSSDSGLPPETIDLPRSLLDTAIAAPEREGVDTPAYDLVIHLLGEQVMPIFFALRQFPGGRHVVLTTQDYVEQVERLASVAELDNDPVLVKNPFKPAETRKAIASLIADLPAESRIAVNMTGGTKLMFAGALSACWELGLDPFYFEIRHHNVIFLRDGSQVPFVGISNVDDFLRARNHRIVTHGKWPVEENAHKNVRQSAVSEMWERRDSLRSLYQNKAFLDFSRNYNRHQLLTSETRYRLRSPGALVKHQRLIKVIRSSCSKGRRSRCQRRTSSARFLAGGSKSMCTRCLVRFRMKDLSVTCVSEWKSDSSRLLLQSMRCLRRSSTARSPMASGYGSSSARPVWLSRMPSRNSKTICVSMVAWQHAACSSQGCHSMMRTRVA
jgi:hypothetical protein